MPSGQSSFSLKSRTCLSVGQQLVVLRRPPFYSVAGHLFCGTQRKQELRRFPEKGVPKASGELTHLPAPQPPAKRRNGSLAPRLPIQGKVHSVAAKKSVADAKASPVSDATKTHPLSPTMLDVMKALQPLIERQAVQRPPVWTEAHAPLTPMQPSVEAESNGAVMAPNSERSPQFALTAEEMDRDPAAEFEALYPGDRAVGFVPREVRGQWDLFDSPECFAPRAFGVKNVGETKDDGTVLQAAQAQLEKERKTRRLLQKFHTNVKGFYSGERSASLSPCPAPMVLPHPESTLEDIQPMTEATSIPKPSVWPLTRKLRGITDLYTAFKRADITNTEFPSTLDIKRTFLGDPITQAVFGLKKQPRSDSASRSPFEEYGLERDVPSLSAVLIPCEHKLRRGNESWPSTETLRSLDCLTSLDNQTHKRRSVFAPIQPQQWEGLLPQCCKSLQARLWGDRTHSDDRGPPLPQSETFFDRCHALARRAVQSVKEVYAKAASESAMEWTPSSRIKVAAMLRRLQQLESDSIVRLSLRPMNEVTVSFSRYAEAFAGFAGAEDWKEEEEPSQVAPPRAVFDNVPQRLFGPSMGQRLVRDGYLGCNLTQYEMQMPGRLALPLTVQMEGPACALAPRNRGGLPRPLVVADAPHKAGISEGVSKKVVEGGLSEHLRSLARYHAEASALREKISSATEERFLHEGPAEPPPEALTKTKPGFDARPFDSQLMSGSRAASPYTRSRVLPWASRKGSHGLLLTAASDWTRSSEDSELFPMQQSDAEHWDLTRTPERFDWSAGASDDQRTWFSEERVSGVRFEPTSSHQGFSNETTSSKAYQRQTLIRGNESLPRTSPISRLGTQATTAFLSTPSPEEHMLNLTQSTTMQRLFDAEAESSSSSDSALLF